MNNEKRVIEMLVEYTGIKSHDITLNNHLKKDLGLDSLDVVEFTMECEQTFNIQPNWEDEKINTVKELVEIINEHASNNLKFLNGNGNGKK
jgi:acyl carrier protein